MEAVPQTNSTPNSMTVQRWDAAPEPRTLRQGRAHAAAALPQLRLQHREFQSVGPWRLNISGSTRGIRCRHGTVELLFVANAVNADDCARCVFDRLIAGDGWYAKNRYLALVWFTCADRVEGGAAQYASKRLWQSRCNADIFVALARTGSPPSLRRPPPRPYGPRFARLIARG
jgi:hypothetical protein